MDITTPKNYTTAKEEAVTALSTKDLESSETANNTIQKDDIEDGDDRTDTSDDYFDSCDDCSSDGGRVDGIVMNEFADGDCLGFVSVPLPGSRLSTGDAPPQPRRSAPNGCAICLSAFEPQHHITWSSNDKCKHVFHKDCILDWLQASGGRHLRRRRRLEQRGQQRGDNSIVHYSNNPLLKITKFPMLCPCCRQVFVIIPPEAAAPTSTTTTSSLTKTTAQGISNTSTTPGEESSHDGSETDGSRGAAADQQSSLLSSSANTNTESSAAAVTVPSGSADATTANTIVVVSTTTV